MAETIIRISDEVLEKFPLSTVFLKSNRYHRSEALLMVLEDFLESRNINPSSSGALAFVFGGMDMGVLKTAYLVSAGSGQNQPSLVFTEPKAGNDNNTPSSSDNMVINPSESLGATINIEKW